MSVPRAIPQYDAAGYLVGVDGPLPGPSDTVRLTYDAFSEALGTDKLYKKPGDAKANRRQEALEEALGTRKHWGQANCIRNPLTREWS